MILKTKWQYHNELDMYFSIPQSHNYTSKYHYSDDILFCSGKMLLKLLIIYKCIHLSLNKMCCDLMIITVARTEEKSTSGRFLNGIKCLDSST